MAKADEFKALNAKVLNNSANAQEYEQWQKLKEEFLCANEKPPHQRRFQRASLSLDVLFGAPPETVEACTFEVCAGGLGIQIPGHFEAGTNVQLSLMLPGDADPTILNARVVWTASGNLVGVEFVEAPEAVRNRIDALVWEDVDVTDV